jgi:hypothetical protein
MTANKFNAALVALGFASSGADGRPSLGQTELANLLDVSPRMVRNWAAGRWPVPIHVALLLNLMLDTGSTAKDLRTR